MPSTHQVHDGTSGEDISLHQVPRASRIVEGVRIAGKAVSALMVCSPLFLAPHPKTPLRVFCIAAFEFLARVHGRTIGKSRRVSMAHACDFASLRDGYYDHRRLNVIEYRSLRSVLRRMAPDTATSRYIQQLRKAERNRPKLVTGNPATATAVMAYRRAVLDVALRWLQRISGLSIESQRYQVLLDLACLMQLADDVLDWKDDQATRNPSYVTGFLVDTPLNAVAIPLRAQADALRQHMTDAARLDTAVGPLALAGVLTWTFVVAQIRWRFPQ